MSNFLAYWPFDPDRPDWITFVFDSEVSWRFHKIILSVVNPEFPVIDDGYDDVLTCDTSLYRSALSPYRQRYSSNRNKPVTGGTIKTPKSPGVCRLFEGPKLPKPKKIYPSDSLFVRERKRIFNHDFKVDSANGKYPSYKKKPEPIGKRFVRYFDREKQKLVTKEYPLRLQTVAKRQVQKDRNFLLPNALNFIESYIVAGDLEIDNPDVGMCNAYLSRWYEAGEYPPPWWEEFENGPYPEGFRVIGRLSTLPYYIELEQTQANPFAVLSRMDNDLCLEVSRLLPSAVTSGVSEMELMERYSVEISTLTAKSLSKHYTKLNNSTVNLAIAFAEGNKTLQTLSALVDRLSKLFEAFKLLKRGDVGTASKLSAGFIPMSAKGAANDLLAYRYGIAPLVNDIQGSAEKLAEWMHVAPRVDVKSQAYEKYSFDDSFTSDGITVNVLREVEIKVKHKSVFKIESPNLKRLSETGFTNPFSVAWELTPFSFVVDWVFPIGRFLESLSATLGLTFSWVTRSVFIRETVKVSCDYLESGVVLPSGDRLDVQLDFKIKSTQAVREVIELPKLVFPRIKNPFSTSHVTSAIALLVQRIKKT